MLVGRLPAEVLREASNNIRCHVKPPPHVMMMVMMLLMVVLVQNTRPVGVGRSGGRLAADFKMVSLFGKPAYGHLVISCLIRVST